jgi:hypothetical protein
MLGAALGLLGGFYVARYWAMGKGKGANGLAKSHGYQARILRQAEDSPLEHCGSAPN